MPSRLLARTSTEMDLHPWGLAGGRDPLYRALAWLSCVFSVGFVSTWLAHWFLRTLLGSLTAQVSVDGMLCKDAAAALDPACDLVLLARICIQEVRPSSKALRAALESRAVPCGATVDKLGDDSDDAACTSSGRHTDFSGSMGRVDDGGEDDDATWTHDGDSRAAGDRARELVAGDGVAAARKLDAEVAIRGHPRSVFCRRACCANDAVPIGRQPGAQ